MEQRTLSQVEREITFKERKGYCVQQERKAVSFVKSLVKAGIQLKHLYFNDFNCCPQPKVVLIFYFGSPLNKEYKRFSGFDIRNFVNYFKLATTERRWN